VDAIVGVIEIGDHEHASFAGPAGGESGSGSIVTIDVKGAGVDDPVAVELGWLEGEALVAAAEDGTLAGAIDEDERAGAGGAGNIDEVGVDAGAKELVRVEAGGVVVAELADVARG
jgi:hypothetical protein